MSVLAMPALAMLQRTLASPAVLFGDLSEARPDTSITLIESTGYHTAGIGAGRYIADSLADEGLLAAHPRFVVRTANGRIFRLMPDAGVITAEQGGARGNGVVNDQPAIQAAIDYAAKLGVGELRFTRARYAIWCPLRTSPTHDLDAMDGRPLVVRASIHLRGCGAAPAILDFRGLDGGDPEGWQQVATSAQDPAPAVWRGGGIFLAGERSDPGTNPRAIASFAMTRMVLRGNRRRFGHSEWPADPATGLGWDVTDKALWLQDTFAGQITLTDTDMIGWRGEILYLGGQVNALERLVMNRCRLRTSTGSAFNPGVTCEVLAIDCEFGDASQAHEDTGKFKAVYRNCLWHDCDHTGIGSGPTDQILHNYAYPTRNPDKTLPLTVLQDCVFRDAGVLRLNSWVKGNITTIDTVVLVDAAHGHAVRDIDVTIDSWLDRRNNLTNFALFGLTRLDEPVPGAPDGVYKQLAREVRVTVRSHRSEQAVSLDYQNQGCEWNGYVDPSCRITVGGHYAHSRTINGGPNPLSFPEVIWSGGSPSSYYVPHGWYAIQSLTTSGVLAPSGPLNTVTVASAMTVAMTLPAAPAGGAAYGYAEGQRVRFAKIDAVGAIQFVKNASPAMAMTATRTLTLGDDWIEFTYNKTRGRWEESGFFSAA